MQPDHMFKNLAPFARQKPSYILSCPTANSLSLLSVQQLTRGTDSLWWFEMDCWDASSAKSLFPSSTWNKETIPGKMPKECDSMEFFLLVWVGSSPSSGVTALISSVAHLWSSPWWCWTDPLGWWCVPSACSSCLCCASRVVLEGRFEHITVSQFAS